jgi:hypothetical protein
MKPPSVFAQNKITLSGGVGHLKLFNTVCQHSVPCVFIGQGMEPRWQAGCGMMTALIGLPEKDRDVDILSKLTLADN